MSYTHSLLFKVNTLQIKDLGIIRSNNNILHKLLSLKIDLIFMYKCLYRYYKSLLKYYISTKKDFKI